MEKVCWCEICFMLFTNK